MNDYLRVKKSHILLLAGIVSGFTLANFVSLVDAKSAGGIVIEKETMDVGSIVLRIDNKNPADIYGGTWQLITGDATLGLGSGSDYSSASISGNNDPIVPLVEHSHDRGTMEITGQLNLSTHNSTGSVQSSTSGAFTPTGRKSYSSNPNNHTTDMYAGASFTGSKTWTGRTSIEGVSNATLDVRGARLMVNVWKRIN